MMKHLTKHGNSFALIIDRGVLDLLEINEKTPLDIKTDGRVFIRLSSQGCRPTQAVRRGAG